MRGSISVLALLALAAAACAPDDEAGGAGLGTAEQGFRGNEQRGRDRFRHGHGKSAFGKHDRHDQRRPGHDVWTHHGDGHGHSHHPWGGDCDDDDPTPSSCTLVASEPPSGASGVAIGTQPLLRFAGRVDTLALTRNLSLTDLGSGARLPIRVQAEGQRGVRIIPEGDLHFFGHYALELATSRHDRTGCNGFRLEFATSALEFPPTADLPGPVQLIATLGELVVTGHQLTQELSVYDLPGGAPRFREHIRLPGFPQALAVSGSRLYAAVDEAGLAVLDADAGSLELIAQVGLEGRALSVVPLAGTVGRVAVGLRGGGAVLLNVANPNAPSVLASIAGDGVWQTLGLASSISQGRALLALAEDQAGLRLFDVSNLAAPVLLQQSVEGRPKQVQFKGNRLLVAHVGFPRISVYDPSDISRQVARVSPCNAPCTWQAESFDTAGTRLFFGTRLGGVQVFELLANGGLQATGQVLFTGATGTVVSAALLPGGPLLGGDERGLSALSGFGAPPAGPPAHVLGNATAAARFEDYAYVSSGFAGLQTFALESQGEPQWLGTLPTAGGTLANDLAAIDVKVLNGGLVLSDARAGVTFYDLADPAAPRQVAAFTSDFDASGDAVEYGDMVYVCDGNSGFEVFDWSDPEAPQRLPQVTFAPGPYDGCNALLVDEEHALLLLGAQRGIYFYDLSAPQAPRLLGVQPVPFDAIVFDMLRSDHDLWLATYARSDFASAANGVTRRVERWSIGEGVSGGLPLALEQRWRSNPLLSAGRLALGNDTLFVSGGHHLFVFDTTSNESAPYADIAGVSGIRGLLATEHGLYAARGPAGFGRLNTGPLPLPLSP